MNIFNIFNNLFFRNRSDLFKYSKEAQKRTIKKIKTDIHPQDNISRSFAQFKAQMSFHNIFNVFILNLLSYFAFKVFKVKNSRTINIVKCTDRCDVLVMPMSNKKIVDFSLKYVEENSLIPHVLDQRNYYLSSECFSWYKENIGSKYQGNYHFKLKSLLKLSEYNYLILKYSPREIITFSEYSFCSSVLTQFCNDNGVEHTNIQHGEKIFNIRDSFFAFDRCIVWDNHYVDLFIEMEAASSQFEVVNNNNNKPTILKDNPTIDFCYYLQDEKKSQLKMVYSILSKLKNNGYRVMVRPHPIYSDLQSVNAIFKNIIIDKDSIEVSLRNTINAISIYSTVLFECKYFFTNVIIDDISNKDRFNKLRDLDYILFKEKYILLSEIMST